MKKIENLRDLFIEQGSELYDSAQQEERALRKMEMKVKNHELRDLLEREITLSKEQRGQLEHAFSRINARFETVKNSCCESVIRQSEELIGRTNEPDIRDAVIINSVQRLNHMNIAGLGALAAYANEMGEHSTAQTIHHRLEDEWDIDRHLSRLAEREINRKAAHELVV